MADGYRLPQQSAGNFYYQQHTQPHSHPRRSVQNETPPNNIRSEYSTDTPPPSRSPDFHSTAQNLYGMYSQSHQQGQHTRVQTMYSYQQQNPRHPQQHTHHYPSLQQEHSGHSTNGPLLGQDSSYSSGVLSNSTPSF